MNQFKKIKLVESFGTTIIEVKDSRIQTDTLVIIIDSTRPKEFEPHNHLGKPIKDDEFIDILKLKKDNNE